MSAVSLPLKFQVGARTLFSVRRRLVRVPMSLDAALAGAVPVLPPLPPAADGYAITSLPAALLTAVATDGRIAFVRQRYTRFYADLGSGFDAWFGGLSANARAQARRKEKRVAALSGETLDVRRFRDPDALAAFHTVARGISATTYQERLLGSGLPDDARFRAAMLARAAAGEVRAWLLFVGGEPAAYLYCPVEGGTVRYEHVGHDPRFNELSPGAVLQVAAMRDLMAEGGLTRFDFTEGEGQHKRQMASGGVACVDLLLLRPTPANRAVVAALAGFDRTVALGKRMAAHPALAAVAKRVRRG